MTSKPHQPPDVLVWGSSSLSPCRRSFSLLTETSPLVNKVMGSGSIRKKQDPAEDAEPRNNVDSEFARNIILIEGNFWLSDYDMSGIMLSVFCLFVSAVVSLLHFFFASNPHRAPGSGYYQHPNFTEEGTSRLREVK